MTRQGSLLIEEPPLQVLPKLAKVIGLNEAIVLQQIHYWLGRSENVRNGRHWVYKTSQEWVDEFPFWSAATVKRAVAALKGRGLIVVGKQSASSWNRTNWYSVDYEALGRIGAICANASDQVDQMHEVKVIRSMGSTCADRSDQVDPITLTTETTSETTTEKPRASRPGEDYAPPKDVVAWVKENGWEPYLQLHVGEFRDTCATQERKPYAVRGLDAAFRKCVRGDWGNVRKQAQMAARAAGAVQPLLRPKVFCRYCPAVSQGNIGGIHHCANHDHFRMAMDGEPAPARVAA